MSGRGFGNSNSNINNYLKDKKNYMNNLNNMNNNNNNDSNDNNDEEMKDNDNNNGSKKRRLNEMYGNDNFENYQGNYNGTRLNDKNRNMGYMHASSYRNRVLLNSKNNNNNNINPWRRNNKRKKYNDMDDDEKKVVDEKKNYWKKRNMIENNKINDIVDKEFEMKKYLNDEDRLKIKIVNGNLSMDVVLNRFINGKDWMEYPDECDYMMKRFYPIYGRILPWIQDRIVYGSGGGDIRITVCWTGDKYDMMESAMECFEHLFIAVNAWKECMEKDRIEKSDKFKKVFGNDFKIRIIKRKNMNKEYKYVVENVYVTPSLQLNRRSEFDKGCKLLVSSLKQQYKDIKCRGMRLGDMNGQYVPKNVLIIVNKKLDINKLNRYLRRVGGLKVVWKMYMDDKPQKEKKKTLDEKLKELREKKLIVKSVDDDMKEQEEEDGEINEEDDGHDSIINRLKLWNGKKTHRKLWEKYKFDNKAIYIGNCWLYMGKDLESKEKKFDYVERYLKRMEKDDDNNVNNGNNDNNGFDYNILTGNYDDNDVNNNKGDDDDDEDDDDMNVLKTNPITAGVFNNNNNINNNQNL